MRETYQSNPSVLAEALCEESPKRIQALDDLAEILHTLPLIRWLEFLTEPSMRRNVSHHGITSFIALPLEKQVGMEKPMFEEHIEQLGMHLFETRYGKKPPRI